MKNAGAWMSRKTRKKSPFDYLFDSSLFEDVEKIFERMEESAGLGTGYSINVIRGPEGTKVYVKASGDTDVASLRRQLQQQYPGAEIHVEGGKPLIREISTKPLKSKKDEERREEGSCG